MEYPIKKWLFVSVLRVKPAKRSQLTLIIEMMHIGASYAAARCSR